MVEGSKMIIVSLLITSVFSEADRERSKNWLEIKKMIENVKI